MTPVPETTVGDVPEMVEKVARALCLYDRGKDDDWDAQVYLESARAAIAAMREPTEPMWSNLARQIVMWHRQSRPTGANLHRDLKNTGWPIPDWLAAEIEDADYVPPKGAVAIAIYRAQIAAALVSTEGAR